MANANLAFGLGGATPLATKVAQTSTPSFGSNALSPRNSYGTPTSSTPSGNSFSNALNTVASTPYVPPSTAVKSHQTTDVAGNTTTTTYHAPEPTTPKDNSSEIDNLQTQAGLLKNQISSAQSAGYGANDQIQTDASGNVAPKPQPTVFGGLISQAQADYKKAGDTNQIITNAENAARHDPNFSLDTGVGRAGLIQQNYGAQGANALTQAQGEATLAANAKPEVSSYGQTSFDPTTGKFGNGSQGVSESDPFYKTLQTYAQAYASGQANTIPSSITGNAVLNAQALEMAKQINPDFNANVAGAQGTSAADLTGKASELQSQANGAEANFNLLSNIAKQGGVNDGNVPILNTIQQNVQRGLASNEAVVNFKSILQSVRDQYAAILGGGTVTDSGRQQALSLIPDDVSLSALQSVGQNLKSDAGNRIAGIQNQVKNLTNSKKSSSSNSGGAIKGWGDIL